MQGRSEGQASKPWIGTGTGTLTMTANFVRFDILKTLPLQEYERWLRLAGEHREWFDNLKLRQYLIDAPARHDIPT